MNKLFLNRAIAYSSILLFTMISCAANGPLMKPSQNTRQEYVSRHPELTDVIKQAILGGRVLQGMAKEDVKVSWGEPTSINNSQNSKFYSEDEEGWHYRAFFLSLEPTRFVEFKNGVVVYFSENYK